MNTRNKINLITFIIFFFVGPIYCYLKLKLMGDASLLSPDLLKAMEQPMNWSDAVSAISLAFFIIYVPDFLANWLRKKYPERRHNFLRYLILFTFIFLLVPGLFYIYVLYGESFYKITLPMEIFIDFLLICIIVPIFSTSLIESHYLSEQWEKETLKRELLEKENLQAQFDVLKSQINPHFLFNSFNTLAELINSDQRLATTFVQKLSEIYRFVLDNRSNEIVELNDELKLFKSYLFLMQIRFGDNLRIHWNVPEEKNQFGIIPLTSQMLLENAVKHNIISKDKPLDIYIELDENDTLVFRNDLQKKIDSTSASTKTGLQNIVNRYKFVADETIDIIETAKEFIVKVPLIKIEKL